MKESINRMHDNQSRLFKSLDATEKQLSTLQGKYNIRKNDCGTGNKSGNSGTWASVVRAGARSKVVSVSLAVVAVAALGIVILLKCWGVIG